MARKPSGPPPKSAKRSMPVPAKAAAMPGGGAMARPAEPKKRGPTLVQFALQVREEARKISWTTWRETWVTSTMVFVMVVIVAVFFLLVDQVLGFGAQQLLHFAS